jgi:hypothetical protein
MGLLSAADSSIGCCRARGATGKYSSATVRGTIWLTLDECDGTLTKVVRGSVRVRDVKLKKTVRVKAGHSYLARAQRAAAKRRR